MIKLRGKKNERTFFNDYWQFHDQSYPVILALLGPLQMMKMMAMTLIPPRQN
jgi:hypothetical protein